jgi:hypothetical protein
MKHNEDGWQSDDGIYLYAQAWEPETDPAGWPLICAGTVDQRGSWVTPPRLMLAWMISIYC